MTSTNFLKECDFFIAYIQDRRENNTNSCYLNNRFSTTYVTTKDIRCNINFGMKTKENK